MTWKEGPGIGALFYVASNEAINEVSCSDSSAEQKKDNGAVVLYDSGIKKTGAGGNGLVIKVAIEAAEKERVRKGKR